MQVTIGTGNQVRKYEFPVGLDSLESMLLSKFSNVQDQKAVHKFCDLLV